MKLHIECLQEKLDTIVKENDLGKKQLEKTILDNEKKNELGVKKLKDEIKGSEH